MRPPARGSTKSNASAPTASYRVRFGRRNATGKGNENVPPSARIPRVTRLLALAHRIDGMIRSGELRDWAEAARLIGVTRARMTQIANLLLLAPEIQEVILNLPPISDAQDPLPERSLRSILISNDWNWQKERLKTPTSFPRRLP